MVGLHSSGLRCFFLALGLLGVLSSLTVDARAEERVVRLTSLEWPPFTGKKLRDEGASSIIVRAAYEAMGYRVVIDFMPWKRAILTAETNASYNGYFPEYDSEYTRAHFDLSEPIGSSTVGFAERKDKPFTWTKLDDLKGMTIGVMDSYTNSPAFDDMAAKGILKTDVNPDEVTCLRKLATARLDTVVLDKDVMAYLLKNDAGLKEMASSLSFNPKILDEKTLYVAFRKDEEGRKMAAVLKQGLEKIDVMSIQNNYLKQQK